MNLSTPLYQSHVARGASFVNFGGWDMPLHYGSQSEEHLAVRRSAGMFDVSHMGILDLHGPRVRELLSLILANDVNTLRAAGSALYTCMLLPGGGVLDDLIVYFMADGWFRLIVNAGTCVKDLAWIGEHATRFAVNVIRRADLAMIAVQGPAARVQAAAVLPTSLRAAALALRPFCSAQSDAWFVARTGYTGEDGFEIVLPAVRAESLWQDLAAQGVVAAGLGARDTLRLEAGLSLYGNELDEAHHPLESGLAWTVAFEPRQRAFIGRDALERARQDGGERLVGLLLEDRGVLRRGQRIALTDPLAGATVATDRPPGATVVTDRTAGATGMLTSGTFAPTLKRSIGLARVAQGVGARVWVDIRGTFHPASVVKPPFVRHGTVRIPLATAEPVP